MAKDKPPLRKPSDPASDFENTVGENARRKLKSKRDGKHSPWFGLGMFGLIGWSIVVPTILGIVVGSWIDDGWPSRVSWKLMLLFCGVAVGCMNAWYWIQRETLL